VTRKVGTVLGFVVEHVTGRPAYDDMTPTRHLG
jgi:hypothetical protein